MHVRRHPELGITEVTNLGLYRQEPWGIFFSTRMRRYNASTGKTPDLIMSSAIVVIDHQALLLFSFAPVVGEDGADRAWAEQALSTWADALRAANPADGGNVHGTHATMLYRSAPWIILVLLALMGYFLFFKEARQR